MNEARITAGDQASEPPGRLLPLQGLRVVDLTRYVSGPFCTMMLADAGADVIKVEPPGGEVSRGLEPLIAGPGAERVSGYFLRYNRHKRSICIDLRAQEGRHLLARMLSSSDILVENYRPGVLESLGFGEAELARINSRLIYCSISGFGHTEGPYRNWPAYHMTAEALAGAIARSSHGGTLPVPLGLIVGDVFPAVLAAAGIMMAVQGRTMTGSGSRVDIAMYDAMISLNELAIGKAALAGRDVAAGIMAHPFYAPWGIFAARDGHVALNVSTDRQWLGLCQALGSAELMNQSRLRQSADRVRHMDEAIRPVLEPWMRRRTREEAVHALTAQGVPAAPIRSAAEVLNCPQAHSREMISTIEAAAGAVTRVAASPVKFRSMNSPQTEDDRPIRAPQAGADSLEILHELGLRAAEIEALRDQGIVPE